MDQTFETYLFTKRSDLIRNELRTATLASIQKKLSRGTTRLFICTQLMQQFFPSIALNLKASPLKIARLDFQ